MANEDVLLAVKLDVAKATSAWEQFIKQVAYGANTFNQLQQSQAQLNQSVNNANNSLNQQTTNIQNLNNTTKNFDNSISTVDNSVKKVDNSTKTYNNTISSLSNTVKGNVQALNSENTSINTLSTSIKANTQNILSGNTAIDGNISKLNSQKTSVQGNIEAINTQSVVINNYIKEAKKASEANEDLGFSFKKLVAGATFGTIIGNLITEGLQKAGKAIKDFIDNASSEFLRLDRTIRVIRGLTQELGESFDSLDQKISASALKTGDLYSNTAMSLQGLLASGITNDSKEALQIYEDIATVSKLAVGRNKTEQEALKETMDSVIVTMKNYDLSAKDVPTILNQISVAAAKSRLDIGDFGKEVGSIASDFAPLKVTFNEAITLFSIFSNKLSNAQEASVALRALARQISSPTEEMKKFSDMARQKGFGEIKFGPTAVAEIGGINNYLNQLLDTIKKFDRPMDILKDLFPEARAGKGLIQALLSFQLDEKGMSDFKKFNDDIVNNTKFVQNQVDELQKSLDERLRYAQNTFTNAWVDVFKSLRTDLITTFENLAGGLNNIINIASNFYKSFDDDNGGNTLRDGLRLVGDLIVWLGQGLAFDIEVILKFISVFIQFIDLFTSILGESLKTGMNLISTFGHLFWTSIFGTKAQKEQAYQELKNFVSKSLDDSGSIIRNKLKGFGEEFEGFFDKTTYSSLGYGNNTVNSNVKGINEADKKEFKSQALITGQSLISNVDETIRKTQLDIAKMTLSEFDFARKKIISDYDKNMKEIGANLESIRNNAVTEIAQIDSQLANDDLTEAQRKNLIDNQKALKEQIVNIEKRAGEEIKLITQRKNLELDSINKKQAEKEKAENEKKAKEYIQALNKKYDAELNSLKAKENLERLGAKFKRADEVDLINIENKYLEKQIGLLQEKAKKFNNPENKASTQKEISDRQLKLQENSLKMEDLQFKKREENLNNKFNLEAQKLDFITEKNKLSDEQILNNQIYFNSKKIKALNDFLYAEKKLMSDRQKEQYKNQINELNQSIELDKIRLTRLNIQKSQEASSFKKEQTIKQVDNIYSVELQAIQDLQKQTQGLYDTKKISLFEFQRLTRENNDVLIQVEKDRIKNLIQTDANYAEKVLQSQQKITELKLTNANLDRTIENEALTRQQNKLEQTRQLSNSVLNSLKSLSNSLKDDLSKSILDTFTNFEQSFNQMDRIISEAPKLIETLDLLSSKQNEIDSFRGPDLLNNKELENLYKDKDVLQEQAQSITNSINAQAVTQAINQIVASFEKLMITTDKVNGGVTNLTRNISTFGANSKQAKDSAQSLNEQFVEMARVIPGIGDLIASLTRKFTDWVGLTKSEADKQKEKDLFETRYKYQEELLNKEHQSYDEKIKLVDLEYDKNLELLNKELLDQEVFNSKKELLDLETSNKRLKIQQDYYNNIRKLQEESYLLDLQSSNSYDKDLQTKLAQLNAQFADKIANASGDSEVNLLLEQLRKAEELAQKEFADKLNQDNRNVDYEYNKAIIEKNYSELEAKLQLIELEKNKLLQDLETDRNRGLITEAQYQAKRNTILINSELKIRDIYKENAEKIKALNEKSYNAELSIIEKLYTEKRKKLESEVEKEISIIKSKNDRIKALEDERNLDQEAKDKRRSLFQKMLAQAQSNTGGDFYRYNELDFNTGNGLTSGNETQRQKTLRDFELGLISLEERDKRLTNLSIQKYMYYSDLLAKTTDPEARRQVSDQMFQAQQEFYEYSFDKELEKIDIETKQAELRLEAKQKELETATSLEKAEILKLDQAYKDSAGRFKDSFVNATKDWLTYLRDNFKELNFSQIEVLSKGSTTLQENKDASNKLLGATSSYSSVQVAQSNSTSKWVPFSDMKAGETPQQYTDRIKAEDAAAERARLAGLTSSNYSNRPTIVSTGSPSGSSNTGLRDYLFQLLFENGQSYDMSHYKKNYGSYTDSELESLVDLRGIPKSLVSAYKANQSAVSNNSTTTNKTYTLQTNIYADASNMSGFKVAVANALQDVVRNIDNSK